MKASVIIPAHDAAHTLPLVLKALSLQDESGFEVILVDDASEDNTERVARQHGGSLDLHIYRSAENLGRARARNLGVEKARGEIILLLDSDIETVPQYVSTHLALYRENAQASGVGSLRYPPHLARRALARYYSSRGAARLHPGEPFPGKYFISCLASFPRRIFEEVGGFDPGFRVYGGEDLELGLKLQKRDVHLQYLPQAVGYHHHLRELKEVMRTLEKYGESGLPLVLKLHPEFARELYLEELNAEGRNLHRWWRDLLCTEFFYRPLLGIASLLQNNWLPAPLLTYLHYRAYRAGFCRFKAE